MLVRGDAQSDRVVPPSGFTARLTVFAAAAMGFLAVFTLALSVAAGRLADNWGSELARTSTVRITAPADQMPALQAEVAAILESTAGVDSVRTLSTADQQALLTPWFGSGLDLSALPLPGLVEITQATQGFDAQGLRLRLEAEVPGAALDDHSQWRAPLVAAAERLRSVGWISVLLLGLTSAAMVTLAANASLAANAQVIRVLRLVGATDSYIAQAFVRRFTLRVLLGAFAGAALGMVVLRMMPAATDMAGFLSGIGFEGAGWLLPAVIPPLMAAVAFVATRIAAHRALKELA
ncbi:FtsX-like permease family protein [uncultured Roseobacter sp.]|uniref:cell division protein FtsX n=1 Tax=uncultured Roseobacter sp. TaxID=114847 RepID=UPI0026202B1F|nr:FtsX-like permease family protein [uncultured Roseobacter sp.]